MMKRFNPAYAFVAGTLISVILFRLMKCEIVFIEKKIRWTLLVIILIAFLFRIDPSLYVLGGQDQGLYVNMSSVYEKQGSTYVTDYVRENIKSNSVRKYYDKYNQIGFHLKKENKMEGSHLPGVFIKNVETSRYVFQFYPLHPLWMAIFAKIFGDTNRVYALVFFSIISIISFYFLAYEISDKNQIAASLAAFFLAINPLHAFFSKFPVTEIVALAFTSSSFYLLIKYYRTGLKGELKWGYLVLSSGLMACFFFTRISGFMYIPFFYIILLSVFIFIESFPMKRQLIYYIFAILVLFTFSNFYGFIYSYPYFTDIYRNSFSRFLGNNWIRDLIVIGILLSIILLLIAFFSNNKTINPALKKLFTIFSNVLPYFLYIVILLAAYRAYQLGYTERFAGGQWNMGNHGLASIQYSNIYVVISYMSPFAFILFLIAIKKTKLKEYKGLLSFVLLFLISFWTTNTFIGFTTPYQYYYARYLLSEVMPYSLLLVCLFLGILAYKRSLLLKTVSYLFMACISLYFLYFTFYQFRGTYCDGVYESLKLIQKRLGTKDLLLLHKKNFRFYNQINTALTYYYGLNVFSIGKFQDITNVLYYSILQYNDIFILSQVPLETSYFTLYDEIDYKYGMFEQGNRIPKKFYYLRQKHYLYKINKPLLFEYHKTNTDIFYLNKLPKKHLKNFHRDKIFTKGDSSIVDLNYKIKENDKYLIINTKGWNPYKDKLDKLNLKVEINGNPLTFSYKKNNSFYFLLPGIEMIKTIRIISSTFIPKELGINNDPRVLGVDIASIQIK